ncbi:MAG TPA: CoA transferase [Acidimicrobiia bacterium]|nr:CoA transferase [Acidimicrobiia bacterium]
MSRPPLEGIRILDLTQTLAGPFATMILGDLGADIVKVEAPDRPDMARGVPAPNVGGQSTYYLSLNRNKRSVALDLREASDRQKFIRLVGTSDAVIENFRPGVLDRLGVGKDVLEEANPGIVLCSLSGFGATGPMRDRPGYDYLMQALVGTMSLTGGPDTPPTKYGLSVVDHAAGVFAALAVTAALLGRRAGNLEGSAHLDVSLFDTHLAMLSYLGAQYLNGGVVPERLENSAHQTLVPAQLFPTSDGYVVVMVLANRFWESLCRALDRDDLAADPRFDLPAGRLSFRDELVTTLGDTFRERTTDQWMQALLEHGVPAAPVQTVPDVFSMDQVTAREMVVELSHPEYGTYKAVANPIKGVETPNRPAPILGEHTTEILEAIAATREVDDMPPWNPGAHVEGLEIEIDGPVLMITLSRPEKANALTPTMVSGLNRVLDWLDHSEIQAVLITGSGERAFCGGFDTGSLQSPGNSESGTERDMVDRLARRFAECRLPIVGAINGAAVGAGCDLAMACDVRVAAENVTFGMPPARLGILYGWGGMLRLRNAVGRSVASEMLLTGDQVSADRAERLGLVSRVLPQDLLLDEARALAGRLAHYAPLSMEATKQSLTIFDDLIGGAHIGRLEELQAMVWDSQDAVEGTKAAREGRTPEFEGR